MSLHPYVATKHPNMDIVIVRENEEDVYGGIEHRQTNQVAQCLKLISRPGSKRIVRYAFEYARANKRKKVTCFTKDNIMKITDGLFHRTFNEIATEYPEIENEHWIVDIGAAKMADTPEVFDVIVMPNLYGDVLSDVAAQITGSVGLAGSANIGDHCSMFEAIHGSAPRRAGQNLANPSGLLHGAILMLVHIGQADVAERVHNAWLRTIEDGIHTYDIYKEGTSRKKVGTKEFADAVIARLGQKPEHLQAGRVRQGSADESCDPAGRQTADETTRRRRPVHRPARRQSRSDRGHHAAVRRRRRKAHDDQQSRHEGLAQRESRYVLERSLVLPVRGRWRALHRATRPQTCSRLQIPPVSTSSRPRDSTRSTASAATRSRKESNSLAIQLNAITQPLAIAVGRPAEKALHKNAAVGEYNALRCEVVEVRRDFHVRQTHAAGFR